MTATNAEWAETGGSISLAACWVRGCLFMFHTFRTHISKLKNNKPRQKKIKGLEQVTGWEKI